MAGLAPILSLFIGALPAHADAFARAGVNFQNAATYTAHTTQVSTGVRRGREYTLGLNADLTQRRYTNDVLIHDNQFNLFGSRALSDRVYVDATLGGATTADIFARGAVSVTPHYVFDGNDFGLGLRYADYRTGRTGALNASYLRYLANGLTLGAATYVVRAEAYITAYSAQALYAPSEHHALRVTGAAGRTLEDRGLEADFNSLATEYTYTCPAGFSAGLALTDYWSQVRRERVIGLRLGWR